MTKKTVSHSPLLAVICLLVIALAPLAALLLPLPAASGSTGEQKLIVLLPGSISSLPQASIVFDSADARPVGQGAWPNLWLISTNTQDAASRLYRAGAHLVLAGDGLLAGCLNFRSLSSS